jgi:hypothetical protein
MISFQTPGITKIRRNGSTSAQPCRQAPAAVKPGFSREQCNVREVFAQFVANEGRRAKR